MTDRQHHAVVNADVMYLAAHYAEHGESDYVPRLEHALDGTWRTTRDIAARAECSTSYARKGLGYLYLENRAEALHSGHRIFWKTPTTRKEPA